MIFLLGEMFKRRGYDGYKTVHHYADVGLTAGAGAAIALAIGADTESSRYYFENTVFLAGSASLMLAFRTATASEPDRKTSRPLPYIAKLISGAVLGVAVATTPLAALPGSEEMNLKDRVLQDNQAYLAARQQQKAEKKAAKESNNVSHETVAPQKRGLGL